jgi:hypothetical protein
MAKILRRHPITEAAVWHRSHALPEKEGVTAGQRGRLGKIGFRSLPIPETG